MQDQIMKKLLPREIDISELIPQRPPFVMIDGLVSISGRDATSVFMVRDKNILVRKGLLQESGVIENIAQTAAAMNGYHAQAGGKKVRNGYIGGIKNLEIFSLPEVGEQVTTRITEQHHVMGASIVQCEATAGDRVIARCEMKVFIE
jgi:predicted hotdog family 3-hydroxylacyl-ACP dehydratase